MTNQALFSSKDKSKKLKCRLLQFLFGHLRVNFMLCCILFCCKKRKSHVSNIKYNVCFEFFIWKCNFVVQKMV